jgi:uncharacterized Zn finger protein
MKKAAREVRAHERRNNQRKVSPMEVQPTVSLASIQAAIARAIRLDTAAYARIERAAVLIALGAVTKVTDEEYTVLSQTRGNARYVVTPGGCTCIDAGRHPSQRCKHQWAVRILLSAQLQEQRERFAILSETERARLTEVKKRYVTAEARS